MKELATYEAVAGQARHTLDRWHFGYQRPLPGELERCRAALDGICN